MCRWCEQHEVEQQEIKTHVFPARLLPGRKLLCQPPPLDDLGRRARQLLDPCVASRSPVFARSRDGYAGRDEGRVARLGPLLDLHTGASASLDGMRASERVVLGRREQQS